MFTTNTPQQKTHQVKQMVTVLNNHNYTYHTYRDRVVVHIRCSDGSVVRETAYTVQELMPILGY